MNCQYCGNPIPANTASCPACGAKCEVQPTPATSVPIPEKEKTLSPEQLAFYAEQEEKCRKEMRNAKKWMFAIPFICLVPGLLILFSGGVVIFFIFGGIGLAGIWGEAITYSVSSKKLEKLQREKLFNGK